MFGTNSTLALCFVFVASTASALQLTPPSAGSKEFQWLREAEKKHARVALLAAPSLAAISAATGGADPVPWLNAQPASTQLIFYASAAFVETVNLRRLEGLFSLKDDEEPGKLLPVEASEPWHTAEDGAGRVAMLLTAFALATSALRTLA